MHAMIFCPFDLFLFGFFICIWRSGTYCNQFVFYKNIWNGWNRVDRKIFSNYCPCCVVFAILLPIYSILLRLLFSNPLLWFLILFSKKNLEISFVYFLSFPMDNVLMFEENFFPVNKSLIHCFAVSSEAYVT